MKLLMYKCWPNAIFKNFGEPFLCNSGIGISQIVKNFILYTMTNIPHTQWNKTSFSHPSCIRYWKCFKYVVKHSMAIQFPHVYREAPTVKWCQEWSQGDIISKNISGSVPDEWSMGTWLVHITLSIASTLNAEWIKYLLIPTAPPTASWYSTLNLFYS